MKTSTYMTGLAPIARMSSIDFPCSATQRLANSTGEYHRPPSMKITTALTTTARTLTPVEVDIVAPGRGLETAETAGAVRESVRRGCSRPTPHAPRPTRLEVAAQRRKRQVRVVRRPS